MSDDADATFTPERLIAMSMAVRTSGAVKAFARRRHDDPAEHVLWCCGGASAAFGLGPCRIFLGRKRNLKMVWALVQPGSFGDFFPGGDFVGWEEAIKRYFDEEMSPEQRAAFDNWDVSYRYEVSRKFTEDMGPLEPHERPSEFRMREARKSLGSLILLRDRLLAVDATLKEIIENLEPGVHQFWPLRITLPKGQEYPGSYYGMVIRRFIDSFVPEQSDVRQTEDVFFAKGPTKKDYGNLAVSKNVVAGAHLWHERRLRTPDVLFSDELQAEITRRGLRIPRHYQLKGI
jgi:hypothetical protein